MHCWVAVTSEAFARKAMSASGGQPDMDALSKQLLQKLREALRVINPDLTDDQLEAPFAAVQRWGSGFKAECHPEAYIWDPEVGIGASGDFCIASTALQAISNGVALADALAGKDSTSQQRAAASAPPTSPGEVLRWARQP